MTTEQLLQPRYKVIADYPNNTYYPVGKVITIPTDQYAINDNGKPVFWCDFAEYPHLFRKLQWWEERDEKDMPEYVNHLAGVHKVDKWIMTGSGAKCLCEKGAKLYYTERVLPATLDEYNSYLKSKTP